IPTIISKKVIPMPMIKRISQAALLAGGPISSTAWTSTQASAINFDFNSLANGATNAQIQNFMNGLLPSGSSVAVTGAVASNSYNADGHVTGSGHGSTSFTLAQLDPAGHGTFIENDNGHSSSEIKMIFSGLTISSMSFDFEVFPDNTCPSLSNC